MHTKDMLALALTEAGLYEMAGKAAQGYYHDFLSPLDLPEIQLVNDLGVAATTTHRHSQEAIMILRERVMQGQFDASAEESEDWANSEEGQQAFRGLVNKT